MCMRIAVEGNDASLCCAPESRMVPVIEVVKWADLDSGKLSWPLLPPLL